MRIFQKGFNFSQDGPGNRLVLHLQGCNFSCPWCSNPEGMSFDGGESIDIHQLFTLCMRSRPLFFDGGGVTFTGGECTAQHDELLELLKLLHGEGINTAVETNGSDKKLFELLPYIDFLIIDLKHPDDAVHKKYTGASNAVTAENMRSVLESGRQALIRIPLINGFNDIADAFTDFFSGCDMSGAQVEVLRYHEYGKSKWKTEYKVKDGFISDEKYNSFVLALRQSGVRVIST